MDALKKEVTEQFCLTDRPLASQLYSSQKDLKVDETQELGARVLWGERSTKFPKKGE